MATSQHAHDLSSHQSSPPQCAAVTTGMHRDNDRADLRPFVQKDFERWFTMMSRQQGIAAAEASVPPAPAASAPPDIPATAPPGPASRAPVSPDAALESSGPSAASRRVSNPTGSYAATPGVQPTSFSAPADPLTASQNDSAAPRGAVLDRTQPTRSPTAAAGATSAAPRAPAGPELALDDVPAEVRQAAQPFLTGDAQADKDILGFYLARHKIIQANR
jgi:hypothetical protein